MSYRPTEFENEKIFEINSPCKQLINDAFRLLFEHSLGYTKSPYSKLSVQELER